MSAYIVVQVEVTEPAGYDDYKKMVPSSLAAYGGKFVVRGGAWNFGLVHAQAALRNDGHPGTGGTKSAFGLCQNCARTIGNHRPSSVAIG